MKKMFAVVFSFMFLGLVGCASTGSNAGLSASNKLKKEVIECIPNISAPEWISKEYFQENDKMMYVSMVEGYEDLNVAKTVSAAQSKVKIAKSLKETISNEFVNAMQAAGKSKDMVGGYVEDIIVSNVDKLQVQGINTESTYSQQIQEFGENSESKTYWRVYTLSSISKANYDKLMAKLFDDTEKQISPKDKEAKELAKQAKERFYNNNK